MDFLDSLEIDKTDITERKSLRVRSWYLYEQYKALEKNQIDAAQKLRNKSYQDRLLRQELSERRARRRLYDEFGLRSSEPNIERIRSEAPTSISASHDDCFESFCELQDPAFGADGDADAEPDRPAIATDTESEDTDDVCSYKTSVYSIIDNKYLEPLTGVTKNCKCDNKKHPARSKNGNSDSLNDSIDSKLRCVTFVTSLSEQREVKENVSFIDASDHKFDDIFGDQNRDESIDSTVESHNIDMTFAGINDFKSSDTLDFPSISHGNLADDIKEELEYVKKNIAENIHLQMEAEEGSRQCLEELSKLQNDMLALPYEGEDDASVCSMKNCELLQQDQGFENNMFYIWSKLVSFAYQVVQLNHGNCYYDYGAQFLTAVLACDVLRRGVNRMCDVLQPYVSPIKFVSDEPCSALNVISHKHVKRKICSDTKKTGKSLKCSENKRLTSLSKKYRRQCGCATKIWMLPSLTRCADKKCNSENCWRRHPVRIRARKRYASEPRRSVCPLPARDSCSDSSHTMWPEEFTNTNHSEDFCSCHTKVTNPMLKIASFIDGSL